jgi:hypothetical protein
MRPRAASVQSRCGLGVMPTRPRSRRSASEQACSVGSPSVWPSVCSRQASKRSSKRASSRWTNRPRIDRASSPPRSPCSGSMGLYGIGERAGLKRTEPSPAAGSRNTPDSVNNVEVQGACRGTRPPNPSRQSDFWLRGLLNSNSAASLSRPT